METNRFWKIAGWTVVAVLVLIGGALIYLTGFRLKAKSADIRVEITPARVEAGKYLANHVMVCVDCHSARDWSLFSGPVKPGTEGSGGEVFSEEMGFPGRFVARNITPYNLKNWTDGQLLRAITEGVDNRNMPLFPVMPAPYYGTLDQEDIFSIIAYLRSMPEKTNVSEPSYTSFPFSLIMYMIPKKPDFTAKPAKSDTVAYGNYLATAAVCVDCHTIARRGKIDRSKAYAGGREFTTNLRTVVSANITPSVKTGIGGWTAEAFIARFKAYDPAVNPLPKTQDVGFNTIMPWSMYAGMDSTDLRAIFRYLQTLEPVENQVQKVR